VIDYFIFGEKETAQHPFLRRWFSLLPIVLIVASAVVFAMCYLSSEKLLKKEYLDFDSIIVAQWVILALTALYAITVKWHSSKPCKPCNFTPSTSTTTPS
jgi:drug/metabolite transporter (DMT)-like permease